jgi:hypothetical protein
MALYDARRLDSDHDFRGYDVCVIGAGSAGSYVAHRLAQQGLRVLVLEAGGERPSDGAALGIAAAQGSPYRGDTLGRAFGLGGTSARWGGQLVPYSASDALRSEPHLARAWRHVLDVSARQAERVRVVLGLPREGAPHNPSGPFARAAARLRANGLELIASDIVPHRRRDLGRLVRTRYAGGATVDICLHAVVSAWAVAAGPGGARVEALTISSEGRELRVRAPAFVLAAGALESARMLLEIESASPTSPFAARSIGRGLSDHVSCTVARVPAHSSAEIGRQFAPRFERGILHGARLLEAAPPASSPRGFFHFIFERQDPAFALVREALAAWQARRRPELEPRALGRSLGGLAALAYDRIAHRRLHIPPGTAAHLQLDIEQASSARRGIALGDDLDRYGRRIARVDWDVSRADIDHAVAAARRFGRAWSGWARELSALELLDAEAIGSAALDAFHPTGLCRLGADDEAVLDLELRVRGLQNLWALSTGVFPSAGSASPVLGLLCLGEELAARLADSARRARAAPSVGGASP